MKKTRYTDAFVARLWSAWQTDPRPWKEVCADYEIEPPNALNLFSRRGLDYKHTLHPVRCRNCGEIIYQGHQSQYFCSARCRAAYKIKREERYEAQKQRRPNQEIIAFAANAHDAGISYGKLEAKKQEEKYRW